MSDRYVDYFIYLGFCAFIFWSFLGGHKQEIYGINLDHVATLVGLVSALISIVIYNRSIVFSSSAMISLLVFVVFIGISVSWAEFLETGYRLLFSHVVYFLIAVGLSCYFAKRIDLFFKTIIVCGFSSAFVVLSSFVFIGIGSWGRMTIPSVHEGNFTYFPHGYESAADPNVLSYFLYMAAGVSGIRYLSTNRVLYLFATGGILAAAVLTFSRSGLLSFLCAGAVVGIYLIVQNGKERPRAASLVVLLVFCIVVIPVSSTLPNVRDWVEGGGLVALSEGRKTIESSHASNPMISRMLSASRSNSDRLSRLSETFDKITSGEINFLFGNGLGYSRSTSDPHNFFLSLLIDSGVISVIPVLVFLFHPLYCFLRCREMGLYSRSVYLFLILFFVFISLFYWQVRTLYFVAVFGLVVIFNLRERAKRKELDENCHHW